MFGKKKHKEKKLPQKLSEIRYTDSSMGEINNTQPASKKKKGLRKGIVKPQTSNEVVAAFFQEYDLDTGIFRIDDETYSLAYSFEDIAFAKLDTNGMLSVFGKWRDLINSLPEHIHLQFVNANRLELTSEYKAKYSLPRLNYGPYKTAEAIAGEFNATISKSFGTAKTTLITKKYLVFSCKAGSKEEAMKDLDFAVNIAVKIFESLGTKLEVCSVDERLELIYDTIQPGIGKLDFKGHPITEIIANSTDSTGRPLTAADFIAPKYMNFREFKLIECHNNDELGSRQKFICVLNVERFATTISPAFFNKLMTLEGVSALTTINIQPTNNGKFLKSVGDQLTSMKSERLEKIKRAGDNGYDYSAVVDFNLEEKINKAEQLMEDIRNNGQKIFQINILVSVMAETYEELKESVNKVVAAGAENLITIKPLLAQQLEGLQNTLPLGFNNLQYQRTATTEATAMNLPFNSKDLSDENGLFLGINQISKRPIFFDRQKLVNQNAAILATSGAGKSYQTKLQIEQILTKYPNDDVIIIDPQREYGLLVEAFGGATVKISNNSNTIINPFDISKDYGLSEGMDTNPVNEKSEFIIGLMETLLDQELTGSEKTIIDRTVRQIYVFAQQKGFMDLSLTPDIKGFYQALKMQQDEEAKGLATTIERFATTQNIFNGRTTVNMSNRLICYDIKDLPDSLQSAGYLTILDFIMNKMAINKAQNKRTWLFIDEFHILMANDFAAEYLTRLYKISRKYGLSVSCITQNLTDILDNEFGSKILSNAETAILLRNKESDIPKLQELFNFSDNLAQYLIDPKPGEGLLIFGKTSLPFSMRFDKDTTINRINSTSLE